MTHMTRGLLIAAIAAAFSVSTLAQATRTFVSTNGNDLNTAFNCSASASCRSFGAALSVTFPAGEIVVLNSGGYGPATISHPVVITAIGVVASISTITSGANALTISTPGFVTIRGLNLHGEGVGANGVVVTQSGVFLRFFNLLVENFTADGVNFGTPGKLFIYNSQFNDNQNTGLHMTDPSGNTYVDSSSFNHNGQGVQLDFGFAVIADSSAEYNFDGFLADGGILTLFRDRVASNTTGLRTNFTGTLSFANCLITNNLTAYEIDMGSMNGTNDGTSLITPGQTVIGSLSASSLLQ